MRPPLGARFYARCVVRMGVGLASIVGCWALGGPWFTLAALAPVMMTWIPLFFGLDTSTPVIGEFAAGDIGVACIQGDALLLFARLLAAPPAGLPPPPGGEERGADLPPLPLAGSSSNGIPG